MASLMDHDKYASTLVSKMEPLYFEFVRNKIEGNNGSIHLQILTNQLSELPSNVRMAIGTTQTDLVKFLRKHSNVFQIDREGIIILLPSFPINLSSQSSLQKRDNGFTALSQNPSYASKKIDSLPYSINDGEGVIYKLGSKFGFMNIINPEINETVYFTGDHFQSKESSLIPFNLKIRQVLSFNAVKANNSKYEAKYCAIKVWIPEKSRNKIHKTLKNKTYDNVKNKTYENENNNTYDNPKAKNYFNQMHVDDYSKAKTYDKHIYAFDNPRTKTYDNERHTYDNPKNKKKLYDHSLTSPRKTYEVGLYDSMTLDGEGYIQNVFPKTGFIEVNDDPSNIVFFNLTKLCQYGNLIDLTKVLKIGDKVKFSAIKSTKNIKAYWEATKVWKMKTSKVKLSKNFHEETCNADENRLVNEEGKICIGSCGVRIKFGNLEFADADSSLFYMFESVVTDIAWEFSDGDKVNFDAIRIKSTPGWKALLVWVGNKPKVNVPNFPGKFKKFEDEETVLVSENFTHDSININKLELCKEKNFRPSYSAGFIFSSDEHLPGFKQSSGSQAFFPASNEGCCSKSTVSLDSDFSRSHNWKSFAGSHLSRKSSNMPSRPESSADYRPQSSSRESSDFSRINISSGKSRGNGNNNQSGLKKRHYCDKFSNRDNSLYLGEVSEVVNNKCKLTSSTIEELFHCESREHENSDDTNAVLNYTTEERELLTENEKKSEIDNEVNSSKGAECSKINSSIKIFEGISGYILKIYNRFAEIKCDLLQRPVAFYLSDFYRNGVSVDVHFDDLKEVLKVRDKIVFDCFEIIDDDGNCWQKVTLAWKGIKPDVKNVLSPEKFIEDKELKVTIVYDTLQDSIVRKTECKEQFLAEKQDDSDMIIPIQALSIGSHGTVFRHIENEDATENLLPETNISPYLDTSSIPNFENIANGVSEILQRVGIENSDALDEACREFVHWFYNNFYNDFPHLPRSSRPELSNQIESSMTNQAVQTNITGPFLIRNIFPH